MAQYWVDKHIKTVTQMMSKVFFSSKFYDNQQLEKQTGMQPNCSDLTNQKAEVKEKCLSKCKVFGRHWTRQNVNLGWHPLVILSVGNTFIKQNTNPLDNTGHEVPSGAGDLRVPVTFGEGHFPHL